MKFTSGAPLSGALHCGRYPTGTDATIAAVAADLRASHYRCECVSDAMRFKYRKLMFNLGNGLEVITSGTAWGATGALGDFSAKLRDEAEACYRAAGIDAIPSDEYTERVSSHYRAQPIDGQPRSGSSTRQSVLRGHTTVEVDYLNGEIELLGKLYGVPTPYNTVVRREAVATAARGGGEGRPIEDLLALVEKELVAGRDLERGKFNATPPSIRQSLQPIQRARKGNPAEMAIPVANKAMPNGFHPPISPQGRMNWGVARCSIDILAMRGTTTSATARV